MFERENRSSNLLRCNSPIFLSRFTILRIDSVVLADARCRVMLAEAPTSSMAWFPSLVRHFDGRRSKSGRIVFKEKGAPPSPVRRVHEEAAEGWRRKKNDVMSEVIESRKNAVLFRSIKFSGKNDVLAAFDVGECQSWRQPESKHAKGWCSFP